MGQGNRKRAGSTRKSDLFLTSGGVDLVRKRAADLTEMHPLEPLRNLIADPQSRGGTIYACAPCVKALGVEDLPEEIRDQVTEPTGLVSVVPPDADEHELPSYHDAVRDAKRQVIRQALQRSDNVQTRAAKLLGITQPYLARLMKNLGVRRGGS